MGYKIGDIVSDLTITGHPIRQNESPSSRNTRIYYPCQCVCGKQVVIQEKRLRSGHTRSCGCLAGRIRSRLNIANAKHGESQTPLYQIWHNMIARCTDSTHDRFNRYGGRGIQICLSWFNYTDFATWAKSHGYSEGLSLDRVNVDGNYEPDNCRFIPLADQMANTSKTHRFTAFGETKHISGWARDPRCHVDRRKLNWRISHGWDPERALLT